jgi:hypothetical protein
MRWLRRSLLGILAFVLVLALALLLLAVLLPGDGSAGVLELRAGYGGAEELLVRHDGESMVRHLALRNDRGERVASAWVRRPERLDPEHRILLTYAGAKTGEAMLDLVPASDDLVLVAVQYPFDPPRGAAGKARMPFQVRGVAYRTVAGGLLAVDYLEQEAGLDPARILLLGASLGSVFATLHGALDERIPEVLLVHGGADLPTMLEGALGSRVPTWLLPGAVRLARIPIDTFDPARYVGRIAPRQLVVIAARDDRHFPADAVRAFFARAGDPKELRWTDTPHVGVGKRDVVQALLAEIEAYLAPAGG